MERILPFLNEYSNALTAVCACLTVIATFLIWDVSRQQVALMDKQAELADEQAKISKQLAEAAEEPIIQTDYTFETLGEYNRRKKLGGVVEKSSEILVIQLSNIGRGSAYNLEIKHHGRETVKKRRLLVGEKYEYILSVKEIESKGISMVPEVIYQDIFGNEFTTIPGP